jgi:beta-lactam-binding protein with PASTA domain
MKTWLQFLVSRSFRRHLLTLVVIWAVVVASAWIFLKAYSRQGEVVELPDLRGVTLQEAQALLAESGLQAVHLDSVYSRDARPFEVVEQLPPPASPIKPDRNVYLTTYRSLPPNELLGVEEGMDARVARIRLENKGFEIEEVEEANIALVGRVVRVESARRKVLQPDARLPRGTTIRLVIGRTTNERVPMPNLVGLSLDSVRAELIRGRLSLGLVEYSESCEDADDSLEALVIDQHLPPTEDAVVPAGTEIDVYLGLSSDASRRAPAVDAP